MDNIEGLSQKEQQLFNKAGTFVNRIFAPVAKLNKRDPSTVTLYSSILQELAKYDTSRLESEAINTNSNNKNNFRT